MDFYESKRNLRFLAVLCVVLIFFFGGLAYLAFTEESFFMAMFFFLFMLLMIWVTRQSVKKAMGNGLYVTTTSLDLILYVMPDEKVDIRWEDILDYLFYEIKGNQFLGLQLSNEEAYTAVMSPKMKRLASLNAKMGYPMFNINFRHITEKKQLIEELDRRNPNVIIHFEEEST
ncbi:hypothetical protein NLX67_00800 [Domibacillus sp. A3M-37]|nr:hypothetical protein [Domibacillus sp. A3M-37]